MPEGDTIHRLARALRPDLVDHRLTDVELREAGPLRAFSNSRVETVEARGKHLLISAASGWTIRTHLGLHGDVHRYKNGERWKRSPCKAVLVIDTDEDLAFAWFEPAQADIWPTTMLKAHPRLSHLGQDLLAQSIDIDAVVHRAVRCSCLRGSTYTIGELLLDQSVACGIGNIYKSEVLFIEGISPFTSASKVNEERLRALYDRARKLLRQNTEKGPRTTRAGRGPKGTLLPGEPRLWVYGRDGQACLRCGAPVRMVAQGVQKRLTFFCPRCQL